MIASFTKPLYCVRSVSKKAIMKATDSKDFHPAEATVIAAIN